jgi:peptide/nickel transport system permease protein
MIRYLGARLAQMVPVVLVVSVVIFLLTQMLPGDPTVTIVGENATPEQRAQARIEYGLDAPAPIQYLRWLGRTVQGDFGRSLRSRERVIDMLASRVPVTLQLTALSIFVAVAIGVPAGIAAARWRGTWVDAVASVAALSGMAVPYFWMGVLLILVFAQTLRWLPPSGYVAFGRDPVGNLTYLILPALTIGTAFAALVMRQTRAAMLEILSQDYVRTARAKGLGEAVVVFKHALRNALVPVVTVIGLQIGALLGGAVVTETVFSLPGLGRMVVEGIFARDFPVIQGAVIFIVLCVLLVNLATDLIYTLIDPRVRA